MKYQFYVTYWAPNGTSDLLVTDSSGTILEVIPEALFGPPIKNETYLSYLNEPVYRVDKGTVLKYLACSPVDPRGSKVIDALEPYFVKRGAV
jgi:hypothetical protein